MTKQEALEDLTECMGKLTEATGVTARLFRPPGGLYSADLLEASKELGLSVIFWSVDPHDWDKNQAAQVLPYLLSHTQAGDIVLMHDLTEHSVSCAMTFIDTMCAQVLNSAPFPSLPPFPAQAFLPVYIITVSRIDKRQRLYKNRKKQSHAGGKPWIKRSFAPSSAPKSAP